MTEIRFDQRVAIVTGAGGGLGRSHALLLASRGAKVVVNDRGGSLQGEGGGSTAADRVVEEIRAAGGEAVASYDSVDSGEGAKAIVDRALETFGQVDILINNAGILRDVSFRKMTQADWEDVLRVHLTGTMLVTKAAWEPMRERGYGRIVNTSSAAGLFGNFGQANYSAAKLGIVGFTKTLAQEGAKSGIRVNAIAPIAKSRMTETVFPPEMLAKLDPELVSPLVAYLAAERCEDSGEVYAVGGGYVSRVAIVEAAGAVLPNATPEAIAAAWAEISDLTRATPYATCLDEVRAVFARIASN